MKESHLRSILKSISWRIFGTLITILVSYLITGQIDSAIYIGAFEFISKVFFFYLHERLWATLPFGLVGLSPKPVAE